MTKRQNEILKIIMAAVLLISMAVLSREVAVRTSSEGVKQKQTNLVVIDAGHGGSDSGKVGINDALEKEINLQIAKILAGYLEMNDIPVILTRQTDEGLYDEDADNKKIQDLRRRLEIMEETSGKADNIIVVSIHQNSYPEEYVHGAQVFYYKESTYGKQLAEVIQSQLVESLDKDNDRKIKENDSYYLLKKTTLPIVIVECGFLSNWEEAEKLVDTEYQKRVAWAIHLGIIRYFNQL